MAALVNFLYTFDYGCETCAVSEMTFHVLMCIMGDKYDIPAVMKSATTKFANAAEGRIDSTEFAEAIALAYETPEPTSGIRAKAVAMAATFQTLNGASPGPAFESAMLGSAALATDITTALRDYIVAQKKRMDSFDLKIFRCPGCSFVFASSSPSKAPDAWDGCKLCTTTLKGQVWLAKHKVSWD